ncbi:MAG: GFA family protein [Hyphomonas sp.]|nr:GFA family protein [Hyphomonas sp.]
MSGQTQIDFESLKKALRRLREMPVPFEGGCMCGQFRYRCTKAPVWSGNWHCHACQKLTGGSFSTAFTVATESFEVLQGTALEFEREAEGGSLVTTIRCAECGVWVYARRAGRPEMTSILAATLDDPSNFVLAANVYVSEAAPWTVLDASLAKFWKMPEADLPPQTP